VFRDTIYDMVERAVDVTLIDRVRAAPREYTRTLSSYSYSSNCPYDFTTKALSRSHSKPDQNSFRRNS
jgi:hypothetical protein